MINQRLEQKLLQKLSPQQIQLIKLLEVPIMELEQRIKKEIEENPVLEEGKKEDPDDIDSNSEENETNDYDEEFSVSDYIEDDEVPNYKLKSNNYAESKDNMEGAYSESSSFREHMLSQLNLVKLKKSEKQIAEYIIGNIDDIGYLRRDLDAIVDDLAFTQNIEVSEEQVEHTLKIIQNFEPSGIGARNLQECLLLQVKSKLKNSKNNKRILELTMTILEDYFEEFSKKHYQKIINKLGMDSDDLKFVVEQILKLNPKPGNAYTHQFKKNSQQITPDFILHEVNNEMVLSLNSSNVPPLYINSTYENMLKAYSEKKKKHDKKDKDTITFVKQKLDSAKWFIDAIKQRQSTLLLTMQAILKYQEKYFKSGDEVNLRPMILKDIAKKTNLDISTISRVANSKYIQTQYGIFSLKFFFSEGIETQEGVEVSTREIKKILKEAIEKEDKKKPLTDEKLAKILQEKGYKIARRTVAKYREQMNILVARLRKEL